MTNKKFGIEQNVNTNSNIKCIFANGRQSNDDILETNVFEERYENTYINVYLVLQWHAPI